MTRTEVIERVRALESKLRAEGVAHLALFGSRARGDNRADSDIDLLVEVKPDFGFSILNLIGVEHIVGDDTGLPANAFMRRSLDADFERTVAKEAVAIF
jgi:predicted nucleotidyltransferase